MAQAARLGRPGSRPHVLAGCHPRARSAAPSLDVRGPAAAAIPWHGDLAPPTHRAPAPGAARRDYCEPAGALVPPAGFAGDVNRLHPAPDAAQAHCAPASEQERRPVAVTPCRRGALRAPCALLAPENRGPPPDGIGSGPRARRGTCEVRTGVYRGDAPTTMLDDSADLQVAAAPAPTLKGHHRGQRPAADLRLQGLAVERSRRRLVELHAQVLHAADDQGAVPIQDARGDRSPTTPPGPSRLVCARVRHPISNCSGGSATPAPRTPERDRSPSPPDPSICRRPSDRRLDLFAEVLMGRLAAYKSAHQVHDQCGIASKRTLAGSAVTAPVAGFTQGHGFVPKKAGGGDAGR